MPALVYTGIIFYLSLINLADTPVKDMGVSDKVMHGGAYFGLALLWIFFALFNYAEDKLLRKIVIISLASIAFGIFIEVLQDKLTNYRQLDLYDILANSLGVLVAGFATWITRDCLIRLKAKINLFFVKK